MESQTWGPGSEWVEMRDVVKVGVAQGCNFEMNAQGIKQQPAFPVLCYFS